MPVNEALREVVDAIIAAGSDAETVERLILAVATGAADATAENCARSLEGMIPEVEASFQVPEGQVGVAPLAAVFQMLRGIAGSFRQTKSNPAIGAP